MKKLISAIALCLLCTGLSYSQDYPKLKPLGDKKMEEVRACGGLVAFEKKGIWGLCTKDGKAVLKAQFQKIENADRNELFATRFNGKWGLLGMDCAWVLTPEYDEISNYAVPEFYLIRKDGKVGLANSSGRIVLKIEYDRIDAPIGKLAMIYKDGKCGMIDRTASIVFDTVFDNIAPNTPMTMKVVKNGKVGIYQNTGAVLVAPVYDSLEFSKGQKFYIFSQNGLYGTTSLTGSVICAAQFDSIDWDNDFYLIRKEGKVGTLSDEGKIVAAPKYDSITRHNKYIHWCSSNGKYGTIDNKGKVLLDSRFTTISDVGYGFNNGVSVIPVGIGGKTGLLQGDGARMWLNAEYDRISFEGAYVTVCKDNKWGVVTQDCRLLIPCELDKEPKLKKEDSLFYLNGRYLFANINDIEYMSDRDNRLYSYSQQDYYTSTLLPQCAKSHDIDETNAVVAFIQEVKDKVEQQGDSFVEHLIGLKPFNEFSDEGEKTIEEELGGNIYTHSVNSWMSLEDDGYCYWVDDDSKSESALIFNGKKISGKSIASTFSRGRYNKLYNSSYNYRSECNIEIEPREGFLSKDKKTLYVLFDIEYLGSAKITPAEYGISASTKGAYDVYGTYYSIIASFNAGDMKIANTLVLPSRSSCIRSMYGGFYAGIGDYLIKYDDNFKTTMSVKEIDGFDFEALSEDESHIILCGSTKTQGYVGFDNPICYVYNKTTKNRTPHLLKLKDEAYEICIPYSKGFIGLVSDGSDEYVKYSVIEPFSGAEEVIKTEWEDFMGYKIGGAGIWSAKEDKWLIHPVYDWTVKDGVSNGDWKVRPCTEGVIPICYKGKWGFADENGKIIVQYAYDEVGNCSDGMIAVKKGGKWGFVSKDKKTLTVQCLYDEVDDFENGTATVTKGEDTIVVDKNGTKK